MIFNFEDGRVEVSFKAEDREDLYPAMATFDQHKNTKYLHNFKPCTQQTFNGTSAFAEKPLFMAFLTSNFLPN